MRIAILADDLTGACDAAAPFARRGIAAVVELGVPLDEASADVVALDVDTRRLSPRLAGHRTALAVRTLAARGAATLFKKVDSTLRGHLAAELRACLRGWPAGFAVLCPAFPAQGRWVQNGRLLVDGRGEVGPVADLAGLGDRDRVEHLGLDVLERGVRDAELLLRGARGHGARIIVADATTPRHLAVLVDAAARLDPAPFLAGSAGLSDAVAERARERLASPRSDDPPAPSGAPWLVIAGSQTSITAEQVAQLRRAGAGVVEVAGTELRWSRRLADQAAADAVRILGDGRAAVIQLRLGADSALTGRAEAPVARALGRSCRAVIVRTRPGGLFLTGGATARACLLALGARAVAVIDEPLRGFARGRLVGGIAPGLAVITKAGGFGAPDAIRRLTHGSTAGLAIEAHRPG